MNKSDVLFIVPPNIPLKDLLKTDDPSANLGTTRSMPMGVLSIAGYVNKYNPNANFDVLDLNSELV